MIELASMPLEDYKAICNATRIRTGQDKLYRSFEIAEDLLNFDKPKKIYAHNLIKTIPNETSSCEHIVKTISDNSITYAKLDIIEVNNTIKTIPLEEVDMSE